MLDWLLRWQQRGGPASDWHSSVLHEYVWEEDLEVRHQAGNQDTPLSDICCASFDIWVRDLGHHKVPALSPWCIWHVALCKIVRIPYTRHMSDAEVRRTTGCSLLSHLVTNRRLRLFGHIARSSSREDQHRALAVAVRQVPPDWKRPIGTHSHTWLHAIEADLGPLNFGLATTRRKATTRDEWQHIVNTATLQWSTLWRKEEERDKYSVINVFNVIWRKLQNRLLLQ